MATKIRLKRIGRRNRPFYRLVVMDSRKRRDGAAIEELGWYNPLDKKNPHSFKVERVLHWLGEGAQMTQAAHRLLREEGVVYRWHLIRQGLDEEQIEKEMQKWILRREAAAAEKKTKKEKEKKPTPAPEVATEPAPTETEEASEITAEAVTEDEQISSEEPEKTPEPVIEAAETREDESKVEKVAERSTGPTPEETEVASQDGPATEPEGKEPEVTTSEEPVATQEEETPEAAVDEEPPEKDESVDEKAEDSETKE